MRNPAFHIDGADSPPAPIAVKAACAVAAILLVITLYGRVEEAPDAHLQSAGVRHLLGVPGDGMDTLEQFLGTPEPYANASVRAGVPLVSSCMGV